MHAQGFWSGAALRLIGAARTHVVLGDTDVLLHRLGPERGEPWVLLHGLGSTAGSWMPLLSTLRRDCRLLLPELSEIGGTAAPSAGLNAQQGARLMAKLIERESPGRPVTLAGTSLGGWMAVLLALERPDLVERLVLIDPGGYRDQDWEQIARVMTVNRPQDVDDLYLALFRRPPALLRLSRWSFYRTYTSEAVRSVLASTTESHVFDDGDLARIAAPTALIWGEHDGIFSAEAGRAMARALPQGEFYLLPECGHVAHWEQVRPTLAALRDFRLRFPGSASPAAESARAS